MTSRLTIDVGRHPGRQQGARCGVAIAMMLALGGCQTLSDLNPVNLYHGLEGGPIADARPPPPNADQPYPNLANTPDKPADPDAIVRGQVANGLIADRAHAQYEASVTPLPPPSNGPPVSRGAPPPLKADPDASNATLAAANAPPPKPVPKAAIDNGPAPAPRTAPTTPVNSTPLPPPAGATAAGPMPDVPASPPSPPNLPGVKQVTAPTPPAEPPPAAPAAPSAPAGATAIAFAQGSSSLPSSNLATLRALAARRGNGSIAVTGFGEATSDTPANQVSAIPLAFARARAIAAQLEAAGVPTTAIRLDAEAVGSGAAIRVLP